MVPKKSNNQINIRHAVIFFTYLMWLDLEASFIFLFQGISKRICDKFDDMFDVGTTLCCCNWIDETHLLETIQWRSYGDFPSFAAFFIDAFDLIARRIFVSFQEEVHIILEVFHW